jgi:hypothetical protein
MEMLCLMLPIRMLSTKFMQNVGQIEFHFNFLVVSETNRPFRHTQVASDQITLQAGLQQSVLFWERHLDCAVRLG